MTENKRTRPALMVLMVTSAVMALIAATQQDWTLMIWTLIAGTQAALTRSYVGIVSKQAEIIRAQGDLINRWTTLTPEILRGLGRESDD